MKTLLNAFVPLFRRRALPILAAGALCFALAGGPPLFAAERATLQVTAYTIDAELDPAAHTLNATAKVTFTALADLDTAVFQLHNALRVVKVTDAAGTVLSGERGQDATIRLTLASRLTKGQTATYTFVYDGTLSGSEESPVEGLKLVTIGTPISYLLYAGRWFPMVGYMTNRFTADIHIKIPAGYRVIGSGAVGGPQSSGAGEKALQDYEFRWEKPGFPGTILAGKFNEPVAVAGAPNIRIYTTDARKATAADYAETALKEVDFYISQFGISETPRLNVVELPDDTVPAYWAPEIAAIQGSRLGDKGLLSQYTQGCGQRGHPTLNDA
jgi:aminopeptidase N